MKKRKRKPTLFAYAFLTLIISLSLNLVSSLYLKQYNNELAFKIQRHQMEINTVATTKEALKVEIDNLASKAVVIGTATKDNMTAESTRVVHVNGKDN